MLGATLLTAALAAPAPAAEAAPPLHSWGFETGREGWNKWSSGEMAQEARMGNAHSGERALWGRVDERAALVHLVDGLTIPMAATLRLWYFVPRSGTFDHLTLNLRTHEHGLQSNPIFQISLGVRKGAWTCVELPFAEFFGWADRAFSAWTVREFEVSAVGVGEILLDDVEVLGSTRPPTPVPSILWLANQDVTSVGGGAQAYFRRSFELSALPRVAWLQAGGDDEGTAAVNGVELGTASLLKPGEYDLTPHLRVGRNVVTLAVRNHGEAPNPSGALAVLGWGDAAPDEHAIVSDSQWRAAASAPGGWTDPLFDDSGWPPAAAPHRAPGGPWGIPDIYPLREPLEVATPKVQVPTAMPSFGRATAHRAQPTGFFHTEQIGGRWWLVDPDGNLFFSLACNAVMHERGWSYHYDRTVAERYPDEAAWRRAAIQRLAELGFNSSNGSPDPDDCSRYGMPFFAGFNLLWAGPWLQGPTGERIMFPDVFDPEWRRGAEARVQEVTDQYRDDPLLIGYWTDNEIQMHDPLSPSLGVMDHFWSPACQAELIRWLRERHAGDIGALCRQWSSPHHTYRYSSFEDLPTDKPTIRAADDPVAPDLRAFVRHILETYVRTYVDLWRRHDPNHLICSNRFAGQFDLGFADLLRPFDLIACNSYPRDRWGQTEFDAGQLEWLRQMHALTGRPVIVSEWGTQARDSHLTNVWCRLDTQAERGECYRNVIRQLWDEGYVVGAHWFCWVDSTDGERANWGLLNAYEHPYLPLTTAVSYAHRDLSRRVSTWRP